MSLNNTRLHPKRLLSCLVATCGVLGVMSPSSVSSQTTSSWFLTVTSPQGTYFKRPGNWFRQSPEIYLESERCFANPNTRLVVLSYQDPRQAAVRDSERRSNYYGNVERSQDYWEVTFQNLPSRCNNSSNRVRQQTWFVYKEHVQIVPRSRQQ
ncbi:hypothetical protein [Scytonema sp. NUACC21]